VEAIPAELMSAPLVSICMPCYNAGKYVAEAIDSVLAQTYPHIEIIVVNDGSKDNSGAVLERYRGKGVKVIEQENKGQCAAANRAFAEAKGDYIKFFDADDILSPGFIEAQMRRLAGRTDAVASAKWGRFYNDDLQTFRLNPEPVWRDMDPVDWLVGSWMNARPMMQCALWMLPRQLLEKAGLWDERFSLINDFEFFARVLCFSREVLFCEQAMLYYRSGIGGSLSAQSSRKARESECESLILGTKHLLARRHDAKARLACANVCQHMIYDLYPQHGDLAGRLRQHVEECGGSDIQPSGGWYFGKLKHVIGWKLARRLQRLCGR
jgi:glycosyltransferase involved in cell wall biosynthesis